MPYDETLTARIREIAAERADINTQKGTAARGEERGIVGDINAAATGLASGLTFGLSDMALAESLTPLERERLLSEIGAHPYLRGAGEIGGAVAGAFAAPGSALAKTPAGYLGNVAAREVEAGLAQGGLRGTAKALGTMGAEGAIQSAGSYLGHSALEDKEATVEGLSGALGTGFSFGAVGGGAVLGVAKGAIAARRLYSRVMDGRKGAQAAESAWSQVSEEALQADRSMAQAAEIKLNTIKEGKIAAQRYLNETNAMARETAPIERAAAEPEAFVGPSALDEGIAPAKGGVPTSVRQAPAEVRGPVTQKLTAPESELEAQLAGTKAKLDEGAALKEIKVPKPVKASKGNESDSIEGWLSEKKAFDDAELSQVRRVEDLKGAAELRNRRASTLDDIRYEATARLLGTQIAKEERVIAEAYEKFQTAAKDATPILRARGAGPEEFAPVSTAAASPGNRKAVEILDSAHEEALLRAKHAADPQEAGRAYSQAEELENLLENLATPRLTPSQGLTRGELRAPQAEQWIRELHGDIGKLQRYEKASAELAEALGDAAPQTAVLRAKAFRQAEDDSLRKVRDRMTRAADDADTFGPEYRTPKQRQNEARANLDEMKVREQEARLEHGAASKKVKEGERAKKAALKTAGAGGGTADALGWMEWLDLPGIPKLSDLPVIGPLVGGLLKMRTMKRATGGVMGKGPGTAGNRVAAPGPPGPAPTSCESCPDW